MDTRIIHELAVAFAQAKLIKANIEEKTLAGHSPFATDEEEIYQFVKSYRFALGNIQNAWDDID